MQRLRPVPLAISYGRTDSVKNSGGRLVNGYAQRAPKDAKNPVTIYGIPGLALHGATGVNEAFIDAVMINDKVYACTATKLYRIESTGILYSMGTIAAGAFAVMASNGQDIVICDGVAVWHYLLQSDAVELAGTMAPPTNITATSTLFPSRSVCSVDGYFVFDSVATGAWFHSKLMSIVIDALSITTAEAFPDSAIRMFTFRGILYAMGEVSVEMYFDQGTSPNAFGRYAGATMQFGLANPKAIASNEGGVMWLTQNGTVQFTNGLAPQQVSTQAIDDAIEGLDWQTAHMSAYTLEGHKFFVLSIGVVSFCYDLATGLWHSIRDETYGRYRAAFVISDGNEKLYVGDIASTGKIFLLSRTAYDFDGDGIVLEIEAPAYFAERENIRHSVFEVEPDTGEGGVAGTVTGTVYLVDADGLRLTDNAGNLITGIGDVPSGPRVLLTYSDDDGRTWSSPPFEEHLGYDGDYSRRVQFRRLGQARVRRYQLQVVGGGRRAFVSRAWIGASR